MKKKTNKKIKDIMDRLGKILFQPIHSEKFGSAPVGLMTIKEMEVYGSFITIDPNFSEGMSYGMINYISSILADELIYAQIKFMNEMKTYEDEVTKERDHSI